jgi:putative hydrolase of the HAD superfamily
MIKAVLFDFGNTLLKSNFPLSWQDSYRDAVTDILRSIGEEISPERVRTGEEVLLKYNTRVNPREHEVAADEIFAEMFGLWGVSGLNAIRIAKDTFASFFMRESELYEDTIPLLKELKRKDIRMGILTNTAYGLDREYLARDAVEIMPFLDAFLASTEVGFRKPNTAGFHRLAGELGVETSDCLFVGDEEVDITGANASGMISVLIDRNGKGHRYGQIHTIGSLHDIIELV